MIGLLALSAEQRRNAFLIAEERLGLQAKSIEKDLWVCIILQALFNDQSLKDGITFKGGTSLSKVHGLIQRFSEDIDLAISKQLIGIDQNPNKPEYRSESQRKKHVKMVRHATAVWVHKHLLPKLGQQLEMINSASPLVLETESDNDTEHTIIVRYPSVFEQLTNEYISPVVRVDVSARAETWPSKHASVMPYVLEALPDLAAANRVNVIALDPERTFWEKACLLHEENCRTDDRAPRRALSRHYYDLFCLLNHGFAELALDDNELFSSIVEHRKTYYRRAGVDYKAMSLRQLTLIPDPSRLAMWRRDYNDVRESMLFADGPSFDEIIEAVRQFQLACAARSLAP